jgi:hypothetical protein
VWTASNARDPNASMGFYIGIYVLFGGLNVVFLGLQFWYALSTPLYEVDTHLSGHS